MLMNLAVGQQLDVSLFLAHSRKQPVCISWSIDRAPSETKQAGTANRSEAFTLHPLRCRRRRREMV